MTKPDRRSRGVTAEDLALEYLTARGLCLLRRNYRCRLGELDLVLEDRDTVVIAEVRYRSDTGHGAPQDTVGPQKQAKLIRATRHFLMTHGHLNTRPFRFDVVAVTGTPAGNRINWIRDAFSVDDA